MAFTKPIWVLAAVFLACYEAIASRFLQTSKDNPPSPFVSGELEVPPESEVSLAPLTP